MASNLLLKLAHLFGNRGSDAPAPPVIQPPLLPNQGRGIAFGTAPQIMPPVPVETDNPKVSALSRLPAIYPVAGNERQSPQEIAAMQTGVQIPPVAPPTATAAAPTSIANLPAIYPVAGNLPDAPTVTAPPAPPAPLSALQRLEKGMADIDAKDYSKAVYFNPQTRDISGKAKEGYILQKEAGIDRDKKWSTGDKIKSALLGAGQGFLQGGLLGAAAGGISAGTNRNYMEQQNDFQQKNRLMGNLAQQQKMDEFNQGIEGKKAQIKNIEHDNAAQDAIIADRRQTSMRNILLRQVQKMPRYKKGENPAFDAKLETAGIEQPNFEPDKKIKPRYWNGEGKLMTFNENGVTVPVLDENGNEQVDESRANVRYDGFTVKPGTALTNKTAVDVGQVSATNQTNNDTEIYQGKAADLKGKIATASSRVQSATEALARLDGLTGLEKIKNADRRPVLEREVADAKAELSGHQTELKNLPKPAPTISRQAPVVGKYAGQTFPSPSALKGAFPNKTEAQIKQLIEANGGKFAQ